MSMRKVHGIVLSTTHSAVYDVPLARLRVSILMQAANEEPPALD